MKIGPTVEMDMVVPRNKQDKIYPINLFNLILFNLINLSNHRAKPTNAATSDFGVVHGCPRRLIAFAKFGVATFRLMRSILAFSVRMASRPSVLHVTVSSELHGLNFTANS